MSVNIRRARMDLIKVLTNEQLKKDVPEVEVGNTVRVHHRIK